MTTYLYADFYFILNFIMNVFLILLTAMLRQKRCRMCHFIFVAAINAVLSVMITYMLWKMVVLQIFVAVLQMLEIVFWAFEREGVRRFIKDFMTFFFLTFFIGGLTGTVQNLCLKVSDTKKAYSMRFIFVAVFLLFLLFFLLRWELIREEHARLSIRQAVIAHSGIQVEIQVLYDTGNQLVSPYTGEAVAVISQELARKLEVAKNQSPILIPYHSIGGDGLLNAYRIESLRIEGGISKKNFLAAVSENLTKEQGVQMILNIT